MASRSIEGIYAAVLLPRDVEGQLDEIALARQLRFLLARDVLNFAFNGATGEYCKTTANELKRCLEIAKDALPTESAVLCGVGAAGLRETLTLGAVAVEAQATGLLVPAPYFFPYSQDDLSTFLRTVALEVPLPLLLYNLPQFTSGFETTTALTLIKECDSVAGIKDSSGSLETVRELTYKGIVAARMIGNDRVLPEALAEGVCDGVVSGVACVVPELIQQLFSSKPGDTVFQSAAEKLQEFISRIDVLPTPWGLKAIAEVRGIALGTYLLPLSPRREKQIREIQGWFEDWILGITSSEGAVCV